MQRSPLPLIPRVEPRRRARALRGGVLSAALALACAGTVERGPSTGDPGEAHAQSVERLARSVERLAGGFTNLGRLGALRSRAHELGLGPRMRSEWIDWFSLQRNVVIEFPGRADAWIYVVAHYDKVDDTPLAALSVALNGLLDPLIAPFYMSSGAIDNATGVAVALELARELATSASPRYHGYRILFAGAEESGLRGSRAHVARLTAEEKEAIRLAIVIDSVGLRSSPDCVMDVSDEDASAVALAAATRLELELGRAKLPRGASSDFAPFRETSFGRDFLRGLAFNLLPGGLLPQRSWFTGHHSAPVLFLSACNLFRADDLGNRLSGLSPLPLGEIHGPRDRSERVDGRRLRDLSVILSETIRDLERRESETLAGRPPPAPTLEAPSVP